MNDGHMTVVVGYDGSPTARAAVSHAVAIARGGRVVIVHAHHEPPAHITSRWRELLAAEHAEQGQAVLDSILVDGNRELAGANWEARLVAGGAAESLVLVAADVDADAIVVGSHGYGSLSAVLGSVSHELVRISDRPVTVIGPRCAERWTTHEETARSG
jgi:nucleotide-binding universal stress UspA family protein